MSSSPAADAAPSHPLLLRAEALAKAYNGVPALRDGRLALRRGSVHALCGGNGAGKSTFLSIVMGLQRRDAGTLWCRGQEVDFHTPRQALNAGISIITQELSPVPGMTAAENLWLGRERMTAGGWLVDHRRGERDAQELFDRLGFAVPAGKRMQDLSLAQIQLVEIAKAISYESEILIMDEPTSAIGEAETETLFRALRNLTARGVGIIYVSHRMNEIFRIADDYTVFRDGRYVESGRIADVSRAELIRHIVGYDVTRRERGAAATRTEAQPLLEVENLSSPPELKTASLRVLPGEIVGIYGLVGAGRSEFLNTLYGLRRARGGRVSVKGHALRLGSPRRATRSGLALVTEDRKDTGLVVSRPVRENISLAALDRTSRFGFINRAAERSLVERMTRAFHIKMATAELPVVALSGGNQQKVVLSRCLSTEPDVLLCDEPTRGVDEGAKTEIYTFLRDFVARGHGVVVVSSDLEEILHISDRILVFKQGRVAAEVAAAESSNESLLHIAS
ncbi:MAG: sugar ABC transporter ATP-binding protein [Verrucomicrobiota bacterium]